MGETMGIVANYKVELIAGSFLVAIVLLLSAPGTAPASNCDLAPYFTGRGESTSDAARSLQYYQKAIDVCPGYIRPYELIGNIYRNQKQSDRAISYFEKAAELGSQNSKLYFHLSRLLFEKGKLEDGLQNINRSLEIRPGHPDALALKAEIVQALDDQGPQIVLYEPSTSSLRGILITESFAPLTVQGTALDRSGVAEVMINQIDAGLDDHGNFSKEIQIRPGKNSIVIEAKDNVGNTSSLVVNVHGEKYALPAFGQPGRFASTQQLYSKSHAVVIGINRYEKWPALEFAVNDAKEVQKALVATGFEDVTIILDEEATHRRILTELFDTLPRKVGRNDRVLFYFAGHGQTEELKGGGRKGYIIPVDAEVANYSATAISMEQIKSLSGRIAAKHTLYVMDSCYSGLGFNRSAGIDPATSDYLRKLVSMRVVQIITAGGKGEQVQERQGHGIFTTFFLKGIRGAADFDGDRVVTGSELGTYLRPTVSNESRQAQTPMFGRLEGEGEFLFFITNNL
jgi:tetratricopeptide (TPR) repeat protein